METPEPVRRRIAEEKAAGRSLRQIADLLTAEGVPTARGGTRWSVSSVQSVLRSLQRDAEVQVSR